MINEVLNDLHRNEIVTSQEAPGCFLSSRHRKLLLGLGAPGGEPEDGSRHGRESRQMKLLVVTLPFFKSGMSVTVPLCLTVAGSHQQ